MKLVGRKNIAVGELNIQFGHRVYRDKATGAEITSQTFYAECGFNGQRYNVPLSTTNEALAIHRIHELGERILAGEHATPAKVTITDVARRYLAYQTSMSRAKTTITKYEYVLATFVAWANTHFNKQIGKFTEGDFWNWHRSVTAAYGKKTAYDRAITIKQMFKWAVNKAKIIPSNPVSGATLSKPAPNEQPVFSPEQVTKLIDAADPHLKPIVTIMAHAGLRFGEVRDLLWSMVQLPADGGGHLVIRLGGSGDTTKTGRVRRIPLHPILRATLETMPHSDDRVFHAPASKRNPDSTTPLNESTTVKALKRLCKECKLPNAEKFKLHSLRHTFASMLARNKTPIQYAQALMGHQNSAILALYYHVYDDTAVEAINGIEYPQLPKKGKLSSSAA
ncbi:MAG TPA: site-specific integrase [Tepidisphaeraceae bacterium]